MIPRQPKSHRQNDEFVVSLHAGMNEARSAGVPKATYDEECANCGHALPECLCQVYVSGYNAPSNEEVE